MLKELYEHDYPRLKRLAYSMAGNECEDILQESFIKMIPYQHLSYGEAKALITTIVKNKCLDWIRHKKNLRKYRIWAPVPETTIQPVLPMEAKEIRAQVNRLPAYTRQVIELKFFEEMTFREIDKIVRRDHSSVHSQVQTGLRKLKSVV